MQTGCRRLFPGKVTPALVSRGAGGTSSLSPLPTRLVCEPAMPTRGWKQLVAGWPWFRGEGSYPLPAYSEFMPPPRLGLSRTQDDKGRIRWTLFGASGQGPARGFWKSFFTTPRREVPEAQALDFVRRLLHAAHGQPTEGLADLGRAGFRILPQGEAAPLPLWDEGSLPRWTAPYLWAAGQSLRGVKYLLTFRPFGRLPAPVRKAYLAG